MNEPKPYTLKVCNILANMVHFDCVLQTGSVSWQIGGWAGAQSWDHNQAPALASYVP